jgi:chromosome segregation ATPase
MEKKWTMTDNFDLSAEMQEVHAKMNRTTTNNNNLHKELASIKARLCDEKKREIDKLEAEYEAMFQARKRRLQLIEAKFVKVEKENESRIAEIMRLNRDLENTQGVAKDFERQTLNHIENIGKLLDKIEHFQQDIGFREEIFALKNANKALLDEKAELEYPPDVAKFAESERLRGISQDVIGFQYLEIKELKSELEEAKAAPELLAAEREAWAKEKKALQERISDYVTKEAQLLLDLLPERRPVDGVNMLVDGVDITVDKADLPMEGDGGSL